MSSNVLVTGAAGFIGGSVITALLSGNAPLPAKNIFALVRSDEQEQSLQALGIRVLQFDLLNEEAVIEAVLQNESTPMAPRHSY